MSHGRHGACMHGEWWPARTGVALVVHGRRLGLLRSDDLEELGEVCHGEHVRHARRAAEAAAPISPLPSESTSAIMSNSSSSVGSWPMAATNGGPRVSARSRLWAAAPPTLQGCPQLPSINGAAVVLVEARKGFTARLNLIIGEAHLRAARAAARNSVCVCCWAAVSRFAVLHGSSATL